MITIDQKYLNAFFVLAITFSLMALVSTAQAAIPVTAPNVSTNYIKWTWDTAGPLTAINVDGVLVDGFDPNGTSYILSDLNPGEAHQITVYTASDSGSNTAQTKESNMVGAVPIGLWIYALVGVIFLVLAKFSQVRIINLLCTIFGLLGVYSLITMKESMDPSIWSVSLIVYLILIISGGIAYLYYARR